MLSDNQAVLKALASTEVNSILIWDWQNLEVVKVKIQVTLSCVPGNDGIEGNKNAYILAKSVPKSILTGPDPAIGITKQAQLERRSKNGWMLVHL